MSFRINIRYIRLRTKAAIYFAACFLLLWTLVSLLLLHRFTTTLLSSFDEQIAARADLIAEKTNVRPRIVPLPQGAERFTIIYQVDSNTDTLFRPASVFFPYPSGRNVVADSNGWRSIQIRRSLENGGTLRVIYGLPSNTIDNKIKEMRLLIWWVLPLGCLFAFGIAAWLSSKLLRPVRKVIDLANSINLNNTQLLSEPAVNDELKELIVSFNRMLLRINEQSDRQTAFFASASHELRTPLSVMQTRLQVLLKQGNERSSVTAIYNEQLNEVRKLNKMINDFLLMSELQVGKIELQLVTVNLPELILEQLTKFKEKAAGKAIHFKISYHPVDENYDISADEDKLSIIISNLLDNAIKYAPRESTVIVNTAKMDGSITLSLSNPVRPDIQPKITDLKNQFYHSKPIHGEGFGLGLWIANQLAVMQGMDLYCSIENNQRFTASLTSL